MAANRSPTFAEHTAVVSAETAYLCLPRVCCGGKCHKERDGTPSRGCARRLHREPAPHCLHSGQLFGSRALICFHHAFRPRSSVRWPTPSGSCARCLHRGSAPPPLSPPRGTHCWLYIDMFSSGIRPNQIWAVVPAVSTADRPLPPLSPQRGTH